MDRSTDRHENAIPNRNYISFQHRDEILWSLCQLHHASLIIGSNFVLCSFPTPFDCHPTSFSHLPPLIATQSIMPTPQYTTFVMSIIKINIFRFRPSLPSHLPAHASWMYSNFPRFRWRSCSCGSVDRARWRRWPCWCCGTSVSAQRNRKRVGGS